MDTFKQAIKAHALRETPREVCGFLFPAPENDFIAVETPNTYQDPQSGFQIAPSAFQSGLTRGLAALYHSHPTTGPEFSPADIALAEDIALPLWLYSVPADTFSVYHPKGISVSLEGRQFVLGTHDCAGLVLDYYQQILALKLPDFQRVMSHVNTGWPELAAYAQSNGLVAVDDLRESDIVLMRIGGRQARYVNHCGVYLGNGVMLHQLVNRPSGRVLYAGYWQRMTVRVLRHVSKL